MLTIEKTHLTKLEFYLIVSVSLFLAQIDEIVNTETSKYQLPNAFAQTTDQSESNANPIFQIIITYPATPIQDGRLAEYNRAVNFEKLKPMILESADPKALLSEIRADLNKQYSVISSESSGIKQYNQDGSLTPEYSIWWMKHYVTYRFMQDCVNGILNYMEQGMSLQTAINQIDPEMQQIIIDYTAPPKTDEEKMAESIQAKKQAMLKQAEAKLGIPIKTELDISYQDSLQIDLDGKLNYMQISRDAKEKATNGRIVSKLPDDPQLDKIRLKQIHVILQTLGKQRDYLESQMPQIPLAADGSEKPQVTEINRKTVEIGLYLTPLSRMQDLLYQGASYEVAKTKVGFDLDAMSFIASQTLTPQKPADALIPQKQELKKAPQSEAKPATEASKLSNTLEQSASPDKTGKTTPQEDTIKLKAENKALKKEIQKLKLQIKKLLKSLEKTKIPLG